MSPLSETRTWLQENLPLLIAEFGIPAASVGVLSGGEVVTASAGVLNLGTGVEADDDSVFQIGSITKVWTATLVMQLVDEGLLDLDVPVRTYLPDFVLADDDAAAAITARQLLSHVAGFEGDIFTDTGLGDDAVGKYLAVLSDVPQLFAPGERFSYNNAGYVTLGRLVEVLRGKTWEAALRDHLVAPLGLTHVATNAAEAILFRAALGHIPSPEGQGVVPAPIWNLARSNAPAGSMLAMTARDLLGFAQLHISGGTAPDGTRLLSAESAAAMRTPHVDVPIPALMGDSWGLGWELFDWDGGAVIGHDGGTVGQNAFLRVVPEAGVAVALLTNGGGTIGLYAELFTRLLHDLAGVTAPALPVPSADAPPVDLDRVLGTYSSSVSDSTVRVDDEGRIWLDRVMKGVFATLGPAPDPVELVGWREDRLLPKEPSNGVHMVHAFVGDDGQGRALYLHTGRADRRTGA
ncbi:serine hydrolase domain-containing protein [Microbacterium sp.]|uniref:serine hydrolase domain-containing protein n=1 Tax=Microbacterium sp. TaxID=51671 RepID=UPI00333FFCBD